MLDARWILFTWIALNLGSVSGQSRPHFNPSIIQDSRLEPRVDGTFGFQYKTEDGISHAAQGDPTGFIQGSYSYRDPTGLKVNFNYFAGARDAQKPSAPSRHTPMRQSRAQYRPQQYYSDPTPYEEPQQYRPRTKPPSAYTRPQNQPLYQDRYTNSAFSRFNDVYDTDYPRNG